MAGIAWELGVLRGIGDVDPDLLVNVRSADVVIGTSAGSAVAAQITTGVTIDDLYSAQLSEHSSELEVELNLEELMARFVQATTGATSPEDMRRRTGTDPLIVGMDRYAIASELAFYLPDRAKAVGDTTSGHLFGQVGLMYERWFPVGGLSGRNLLLVAWSPAELSDEALANRVERLDPIQQGALTRDTHLIRPFYYRVAYGFLPAKTAP